MFASTTTVTTVKTLIPWGLLVLIPSALYLSGKAHAGAFDAGFYVVQALELIAGAVNIALLGLNMRDGLKLAGKIRHRSVDAKPL